MKFFYSIAVGDNFDPVFGEWESKNIDTAREEIRLIYKGQPLVWKSLAKIKF